MTPNVRRILMSNKTFANHLADEEAALAQQQQSTIPTITPRVALPKAAPLTPSASHDPATDIVMRGTVSEKPKDPLDNEPLLMVNVPKAPSEEEMNALLAAPPLSYNAARSMAPTEGKPRRYFCEICGYWGTVKCLKCGARVCGLECKVAHDDGRCLKFYA